MLLRVTSRIVDGILVVDLAGEISRRGPSLEKPMKELLEQGRSSLVLNLAGITYVDSSGLSQLLTIWSSVGDKRGQLILLQPSTQVQTQFRMTKLDTVFTILQEEQEAILSIQKKNARS